MKKIRIKGIVMRICAVILVVFMISVALRMFSRLVLVKKFHMDNAFTRLVFAGSMSNIGEIPETAEINWAERYPFEGEDAYEALKDAEAESCMAKYVNKVNRVEENIEPYLEKWLLGYVPLLHCAKGYEEAMGWNLSVYSDYNSVVKLSDGYLTVFFPKRDVSENVEAVKVFRDFCAERGIDFVYVQAPYKISKEDTNISGILDFTNQNMDDFLEGISRAEIDYLDFREIIYEQGHHHRELFFRTDHHWKPETGLWAAGVLAEELNSRYGFAMDTTLFDLDKFDFVLYEKYFLGSRGKRVTLARTTPEDISLIYPKYDTNLYLKIPSEEIDTTGDFSIIYDMSQVETIDYYNLDPYSTYSYGSPPVVEIRNGNQKEGKHILFIKDSFVNTVAPFMALGVERVDELDIRYFTGSVETYIEETQPDIVIVMYAPSAIDEIKWNTHKSTFDFR